VGELQRTLRPAQVRRGLLDVSTADELVRAMQAPNESRIDIVLSGEACKSYAEYADLKDFAFCGHSFTLHLAMQTTFCSLRQLPLYN
jgi:hypothetical protein